MSIDVQAAYQGIKDAAKYDAVMPAAAGGLMDLERYCNDRSNPDHKELQATFKSWEANYKLLLKAAKADLLSAFTIEQMETLLAFSAPDHNKGRLRIAHPRAQMFLADFYSAYSKPLQQLVVHGLGEETGRMITNMWRKHISPMSGLCGTTTYAELVPYISCINNLATDRRVPYGIKTGTHLPSQYKADTNELEMVLLKKSPDLLQFDDVIRRMLTKCFSADKHALLAAHDDFTADVKPIWDDFSKAVKALWDIEQEQAQTKVSLGRKWF